MPEMRHEEKQQITAAHSRSASASTSSSSCSSVDGPAPDKAARQLERERERLREKKLAVERAKEKQRRKVEDEKDRLRLKKEGKLPPPPPPPSVSPAALTAAAEEERRRAERAAEEEAERQRRVEAQEAMRKQLEEEIEQLKQERRLAEEEAKRKRLETEELQRRQAEAARLEQERLAHEQQRQQQQREEEVRQQRRHEAERLAREQQLEDDRRRIEQQRRAEVAAAAKAAEERRRAEEAIARQRAEEEARRKVEAARPAFVLPTFVVEPTAAPPSSREEADVLAQRFTEAVQAAMATPLRRKVRVVREEGHTVPAPTVVIDSSEQSHSGVASQLTSSFAPQPPPPPARTVTVTADAHAVESLSTVQLPSFAIPPTPPTAEPRPFTSPPPTPPSPMATPSPPVERTASAFQRIPPPQSPPDDDTSSIYSHSSHLSTQSTPVRKARKRWTAPAPSTSSPSLPPPATAATQGQPLRRPSSPAASTTSTGTGFWSVPVHPTSAREERLAERRRSSLLARQARRLSLKDQPAETVYTSPVSRSPPPAPSEAAPGPLPSTSTDAQRWAVTAATPHTAVDDSYAAQYSIAQERRTKRATRRSTMPVPTASAPAASPSPAAPVLILSTSDTELSSQPSAIFSGSAPASRRSSIPPPVPVKPRSNRQQLNNALLFTLLSSPAHTSTRLSVLHTLVHCPGSHFLLLLTASPSRALSFRGLFALDIPSQRAVQVWGGEGAEGRVVVWDDVSATFKYDSGRKELLQMDSRRFTLTTDAFTLRRRASRR